MPYSENAHQLLKQVLLERNASKGQITSAMTTSRPCPEEELVKSREYYRLLLPGVKADTIDSFLQAYQTSLPVEEVYGPQALLVLLPDAEMREIFKDDKGWDRFREMYPGSCGTLDLSSPGFSADGMQAMIATGQQGDWAAGGGMVFLYEKRDGIWQKVCGHMTWIS